MNDHDPARSQREEALALANARLRDYQEALYRKKAQGKGYSLLLAIFLFIFLLVSTLSVKLVEQNGDRHLELATHSIPWYVLLPCLILAASALGVDTDPLAEYLGKIFFRKRGTKP